MSYSQFVTQWRLRRIAASGMVGGLPAPAFLYIPSVTPMASLGITATRADSTTCARYRDQAGIWQLAAANVPRELNYVYGDGRPSLLREAASTNSALQACDFTNAAWVGGGSFTLAAATSCIAGRSATKHTDAAGGAVRTQDVGIFVSAQTDCEQYILEDTGDGNASSDITIYDATVGAALYTARVTWATKTIATTAGTGSCGIINDGNGRYRCWVAAAGVAAGAVAGGAGNTRQLRIAPVITAGKSCIVHYGGLEANASYPSSPIVTVGSAVTRAADDIYVAFPYAPQSGTFYADVYDLMGTVSSGVRMFQLGAGVQNLLCSKGTTVWAQTINTTAGASTSTAAAATTYGNRVEARAVVVVTGANVVSRLGQAVNGGTEAVAADGISRALDATWSGSPVRFYIGSNHSGAAVANLAIRSLAIVLGPEQSMANMRMYPNN